MKRKDYSSRRRVIAADEFGPGFTEDQFKNLLERTPRLGDALKPPVDLALLAKSMAITGAVAEGMARVRRLIATPKEVFARKSCGSPDCAGWLCPDCGSGSGSGEREQKGGEIAKPGFAEACLSAAQKLLENARPGDRPRSGVSEIDPSGSSPGPETGGLKAPGIGPQALPDRPRSAIGEKAEGGADLRVVLTWIGPINWHNVDAAGEMLDRVRKEREDGGSEGETSGGD